MPRNRCLPKGVEFNGRVRCWDCGDKLLTNDDLNPDRVVGEHRATDCNRPQSGGKLLVEATATKIPVVENRKQKRSYSKWKDIQHKER